MVDENVNFKAPNVVILATNDVDLEENVPIS